ncbi:MAG: hypothetical protein HY907_21155 [Deltaproteobacteria bacterium]|nr:hypothetical protein [Deltaproteobacteria bacterium]
MTGPNHAVLLVALFATGACATAESPDEEDEATVRDHGADRTDGDAPGDVLADADSDAATEADAGPDDGTDRADGADAGDGAPDVFDADSSDDSPHDADVSSESDLSAEADAEASVEAEADTPPGPCAGARVGGHCWYLSGEERSCDNACAAHGGYDDATRTYAGSSGTDANCDAVLDALGAGGSATSTLSGSGAGVGCFLMNMVDSRYRVQDTPTTPAATYLLARRACACTE